MRLQIAIATLTLIMVGGSASVSVASNDSKGLTSDDIANIKRICRSVFGAPAKDIGTALRPLQPYALSKRDLNDVRWVCSSQHCRGGVALRDDAEIIYGFISIPDPSTSNPMDITPDSVRKGNNRINAIGLVKHRKILFAMPTNAAPFLKHWDDAR